MNPKAIGADGFFGFVTGAVVDALRKIFLLPARTGMVPQGLPGRADDLVHELAVPSADGNRPDVVQARGFKFGPGFPFPADVVFPFRFDPVRFGKGVHSGQGAQNGFPHGPARLEPFADESAEPFQGLQSGFCDQGMGPRNHRKSAAQGDGFMDVESEGDDGLEGARGTGRLDAV